MNEVPKTKPIPDQAPPSDWLFSALRVRQRRFCPSLCLSFSHWSYSKKFLRVDYGNKCNLQNKNVTRWGNSGKEKIRQDILRGLITYLEFPAKFSSALPGSQRKVGNICSRIQSGHEIKTNQLLGRSITFPGIKI